jgi:hypothetical protein
MPLYRRKKKVLMIYRALAVNPNLEAIQREARKLLRALRQNDVTATERYRPFDLLENRFHARLADAQYIIARRYGFKSWANLKESLNVRRKNTAGASPVGSLNP